MQTTGTSCDFCGKWETITQTFVIGGKIEIEGVTTQPAICPECIIKSYNKIPKPEIQKLENFLREVK